MSFSTPMLLVPVDVKYHLVFKKGDFISLKKLYAEKIMPLVGIIESIQYWGGFDYYECTILVNGTIPLDIDCDWIEKITEEEYIVRRILDE